MLPGIAFVLLFCYGPMYGLVVAFKDYKISKGILDSPWANPWYNNFAMMFKDKKFNAAFFNTIRMGLAYRDIFVGTGLLRSFFNSVLYTVTGTIFSMFLATTLAYELSKKNYPGRALFQNMIVFTMYFGGGVVPFFLLIKDLGLYGNRFAVVIALAFNAFNMIILRNFFESLPPDLEEAAMLDGASPFRIFWQIDLPLMKPALATVTLYFIVDRWNEWFWSNLLFLDSKMWPMQLELRQILWTSSALAADVPAELGRRTYADGMKAAAVIVTMLPIMCVYPFLQKYFAKGVMIGAIKS